MCLAGCTRMGANLEGPLPAVQTREISHAESIDEADWPSWRGGDRHGVSPSTAVPSSFSAHRNVHWKISLDGRGNSSPVVFGTQVYLTRSLGAGHRAQLEVVAFDRTDGEIVWSQRVGRPVGSSHEKNGYASATVATDGEHVLAYFGPKGLYCFFADGKLNWHRPYNSATHQWGSASSPAIAGGLAIQLVESESDSFLAAYDLATGNQKWRTARESTGCWTSPVVTKVGNRWNVVVNGSGSRDGSVGSIAGYDLASGRELWSIAGTSDIVCPTAIVGEGLIVSATGDNGPVLTIDTLQHSPKVKWQHASGGTYVPTGLIYRDRLYLVDDDGIMRCISLQDGSSLWKERLGASVSTSLVAAAGRIYVAAESGEVFVVAAADEFQLLAKNNLREPIMATPAIAGNALFIRGESHLYCISEEIREADLPRPNADDATETALSPSDVLAAEDAVGS